jgi:membrane-bound acyltransferase YfiQ involved in biofilm formation
VKIRCGILLLREDGTGMIVQEAVLNASPKILSMFGDYSYSLYLIHTSIILATFSVWSATYKTKPGLAAGAISLGVVLVFAVILGRADVSIHGRQRKKTGLLLAGLSGPRPARLDKAAQQQEV